MTKEASPNKAIKHSTIYAIGNILRQLAGFIMLPIYTHYLNPHDYGVVGLFVFFIGLMEIFFGARLVQAVPKFYHDTDDQRTRNAVVSTALIITFFVSIFFTVLMIVFSESLSNALLGDDHYGKALALFSVLLVTQAVEFYGMTFLRILERPIAFITVSLFKLVLQLALNVWFIVELEMGVLGIALSSAISSSLFAVFLAGFTLLNTGVIFDKTIAVRQVLFCWPLWVGALAGIYIGSANRLYIRFFSTLDDIGLYELAVKFSSILLLLVWEPFSQFWNVERFAIYRNSNDVAGTFRLVFRFLVLLLAVVGVGISIFAQPVIELMSDKSFHLAFEAVPFLVGGTFFGCLVLFCDFAFLATERTARISQNTYVCAAFVSVFYISLIPAFGFLGAALALMFAQFVHFLVTYIRSKSLFDMSLDMRFLSLVVLISSASVTAALTLHVTDILWIKVLFQMCIYLLFCVTLYFVYARDATSKQYMFKFLELVSNRFGFK